MNALDRFLRLEVGNAHPAYWVALIATLALAVLL